MSKPLSNPFGPAKGPQKKPINNPFGDLKVYANDQDETEQLNTQPVNTNQGRGVGNPYRSTTPDPDELQGSITINPAAPKRQASFESQSKPAPINNPFGKTANPQPQPINQPYNQPFNPQQNPRANQQRPENEVYNDPRYRNQPVPEPEFIGNFKKSSWYETILSGLKLIKVANPDLVPNQEAEYIDNDDEFNEPPLLEDLGIDLDLIKMRALSVLKLKRPDERAANESDFWGPLLLFMALGVLLLLSGKIHFGYIYGFGLMGTTLIYLIMNLLGQSVYAKYYNIVSILGYSLFPIVILSSINIILNLQNLFGLIMALAAIILSTYSATNFFEVLLQLDHRKWLVAYPIFLFYLVFVLITIF